MKESEMNSESVSVRIDRTSDDPSEVTLILWDDHGAEIQMAISDAAEGTNTDVSALRVLTSLAEASGGFLTQAIEDAVSAATT